MTRLRYDTTADAYVGSQVIVPAAAFRAALTMRTAAGTPVDVALRALLDEAVWLADAHTPATTLVPRSPDALSSLEL